MRALTIVLLGVLSFGLGEQAARAQASTLWEDVFGKGQPKVWAHPQGTFRLTIPPDWQPSISKKKTGRTELWLNDRGVHAHVTIDTEPVPEGTKTVHFARQRIRALKKKPGFQILEEDHFDVDKTKSLRTWFTYREKGNLQLTNEVVQVAFVKGATAFSIQLETALHARARFWRAFEGLLIGFASGASVDTSYTAEKKSSGPLRPKPGVLVDPEQVY